jgi:hypothetical protein
MWIEQFFRIFLVNTCQHQPVGRALETGTALASATQLLMIPNADPNPKVFSLSH